METMTPPRSSEQAPPARLDASTVEREVRAALDEIAEDLEPIAGELSLDTPLAELGLDSIEHVELIGIAWERCGLETGVPMTSEVRTLGALVDCACAALGLARGEV